MGEGRVGETAEGMSRQTDQLGHRLHHMKVLEFKPLRGRLS
jgi:hypothetical protein